jgi:hypothetical protein
MFTGFIVTSLPCHDRVGMWVTSQVALRCGQLFHGYDVAQLFGFPGNKNEWADHKVISVR